MSWAVCRDAAERREFLLFGTAILTLSVSVLPFGFASSDQSAVPSFFGSRRQQTGAKQQGNSLTSASAWLICSKGRNGSIHCDKKEHVLATCGWGEMKPSVMKQQDLEREKENVIFLVARLLFQQGCTAFQLERVWKLNLKLPPSPSLMASCMDLKFA